MEKDQASQVYGSLKTDVHHAGYSLERAMAHLEWILQKDRWKGVGNGFKDINNFLETLRLGDNNVQSSIDQRKRIVKLIKTLQPEASNRQIAKTVGVGSSTVNRVVAPNGAPTAENPNETNDAERTTAPNGAPGLSAIVEPPTLSGAEVVRLAQRQEAKAESAGRAEQRRQESRSAPPLPDGMDLRIGDCRDVLADIKDSSVALVLTDPPYAEEAEPLYRWLAKWAARVLIPGGSLICYTGHWSLNRDIGIFDEHLRYWWALAMLHHQSRRLPGKFVIADFKPVLWYVKEFRRGKTLVSDVLEPPKREKDDHDWGQGEGGVTPLIEHLAQPGELIVDPFAGTATWGRIAASLGRRWVGSDLVLGGSTEIAA
jgi:hypothetical protein